MREKLTSRKFWLCVAAALASLGTGISGLVQGNDKLALAGGILLVVSSSIYAFCEAWVDSKATEHGLEVHYINDKDEEE